MEEVVQDRVQVEVWREEQVEGETHGKKQGEEQRSDERKQSTAHHGWPWGWRDALVQTLEPTWYDTHHYACALCRRKMTCEVHLCTHGQVRKWDNATMRMEQEDEGRQSICAGYSAEQHGLLEADHRASRRTGGVPLSYVCPHCHRYPLKDYIWWVASGHGKKQRKWWCAEATTIGRPRIESWSYKSVRTAEKQKCFEHKLRRKAFATTWSMRSGSSQTSRKWWQSNQDGGAGPSREKSTQNNRWAQKVHHGRQLWSGESWWLSKEDGVEASGEAEFHDRLAWSSGPGRSWWPHVASRRRGMLRTFIDTTDVGDTGWGWGLARHLWEKTRRPRRFGVWKKQKAKS